MCVHNHLFAHRYERRTSSALKSTSPPPPHHLNTTQQRNLHFLYLSAHNDHNNFIDHVLCLCVCIQGSSPQKKSIDEHLNRNVILMKSVETSCKSCMCLQQWLRTMFQDASLSLSPANPDITVNSQADLGVDESERVKHHLASNGVDTMTAPPSLSVSSSEQDVSVSQSPQPLLFNTEPSQ